ncbi:hypothetical protein ACFUMH_13875 [Cellulomonas sp. NPDC057328]|uniref:hypothetical protein n=1 Tax=Cellulomonas sp. NPDC057328 TaxID=3346101 RepID=UPI00363C045C
MVLLPVAFTVMAAGIARSDVADTALARDLQAHGVQVTVTEVQVYDACTGRGCFGHDEVRIRLDGATHTLRGISPSFGEVPGDRWTKPPTGSRYAPPLPVVHDRDDPGLVMAVEDVREYVDGEVARSSVLILAAAGFVTAVLLGFFVWRVGLPYLLGWRIT